MKESIKVLIEYMIDADEVVIKSQFKDDLKTYKLIKLGLDKWINEKIGYHCPNCDSTVDKNQEFCGQCGQRL